MNLIKAAAVGATLMAVTSCSAAQKKNADFVLIDGQATRLPVMSCQIPDGCVALGKVIWSNKASDPVRYHIQAVGVSDGAQSTVSGGFLVSQRNPLAFPAQSPELSVPGQLAQWASGEICGIYGFNAEPDGFKYLIRAFKPVAGAAGDF